MYSNCEAKLIGLAAAAHGTHPFSLRLSASLSLSLSLSLYLSLYLSISISVYLFIYIYIYIYKISLSLSLSLGAAASCDFKAAQTPHSPSPVADLCVLESPANLSHCILKRWLPWRLVLVSLRGGFKKLTKEETSFGVTTRLGSVWITAREFGRLPPCPPIADGRRGARASADSYYY